MFRPILQSIVFVGFLGGALFLSAGGIGWAAGWLFLVLFSAILILAFVLVPLEVIDARTRFGSEVKRWDTALAGMAGLLLYPGTLIVAGLDIGRVHWSPALPLFVHGLGFSVFAVGYLFALSAMRSNPFFETFVRIQADRGHHVVATGPYATIRHPGYAGACLAHMAIPLALGSLAALAAASIGVVLFVVRTKFEDDTLSRELAGYAEYRSRVRWRLVPGVW
jgi:protein-S-isoprenylcysteine O-methyltransferase Ste14